MRKSKCPPFTNRIEEWSSEIGIRDLEETRIREKGVDFFSWATHDEVQKTNKWIEIKIRSKRCTEIVRETENKCLGEVRRNKTRIIEAYICAKEV